MSKSKIVTVLVVIGVFLLFSGIAAIAIIISRGGTFTDDGLVLDSGVMRIFTEPDNIQATYYLNDERVDPQDRRVFGIVEGDYKLRIEAEGFATWEKIVRVDSGLVLDVFAKLYPESFSAQQFTNTNVDRAFFSPNGEYVYYFVKESPFGANKGLWKIRLTQGGFIFNSFDSEPEKLSNLSTPLLNTVNGGDYEIVPSIDNNRLLLIDHARDMRFILNTGSFTEAGIVNLDSLLGFKPDNVSWFNGSSSVIVQHEQVLFEYNISSGVSTLITYSPEKPIVYAAGNGAVYIYDHLTQQLEIYQNQSVTPVELENVTLPQVITELHTPLNNERFVMLKSGAGSYYYLDTESSLIRQIQDTAISFHQFAQDGRSALFTKDKRVFTYTVREIIARNTIETKLTDTGFVLDSEDDTAGFVPQSTHILHYANGEDHTISIADKDGANHVVLLQNAGIKNSDFSVDSDGSTFVVLLTDEIGDQESANANLYTIDLQTPNPAGQ
ncbi:MAG: hypothetical protein TR69_WS6001000695 [candidate division WS6 bacterium OLB20]|uniref:PEGA domain-containing protein n=1 Tax=candidate division WS6 bacterium OLB20 TaxID=1617426 RepID=A0A136LYD8_9BACT|nr:MAG: hypothetical protein TR69_WS6001000695 [candidate division WS6 bacterium OLB20]